MLKNTVLKYIGYTFLFLLIGTILALALRGNVGSPNSEDINTPNWKEDGPFELSPERGRFALTYSLIEDQSFYFSVPLARFTTPDLGYKNGHYVSLFAPGVSYITGVGYYIGRLLGNTQVGTFATVAIFGMLNVALLIYIIRKLGIISFAAIIASLVFLFATPSFTYAVTLYQHHISTFLILASIALIISFESWIVIFIVWFLCAMSIPVDYPNLILMAPIMFYIIGKIIKIRNTSNIKLVVSLPKILTVLGVVLPLTFFLWFNQSSYANSLQFSGTVPSVHDIDEFGQPAPEKTVHKEDIEKYLNPDLQKKTTLTFFKPRNMVNGLYIHLFSPDRGIISFTPVILFGVFGAYLLYQRNRMITVLLLSIIILNVLLYSMWGDPWGGWAFGSRYLIPAYAILSIFIAALLDHYRKNIFILITFFVIASYSVYINTAGALSSSANPPKVQVLGLEQLSGRRERYSFDRNVEYLKSNNSKSFVYKSWANNYVNAWEYFQIITTTIVLIIVAASVGLYLKPGEKL